MKRKLLVKMSGAALAVACMLGGASAHAATLVDTGSERNGRVGDVRYGASMIDRIYGQITLTKAWRIDTIQGYIDSYGGVLGVHLRADANGKPGDILKNYSTTFEMNKKSNPFREASVWQGPTNLGWQVAAGTY